MRRLRSSRIPLVPIAPDDEDARDRTREQLWPQFSPGAPGLPGSMKRAHVPKANGTGHRGLQLPGANIRHGMEMMDLTRTTGSLIPILEDIAVFYILQVTKTCSS